VLPHVFPESHLRHEHVLHRAQEIIDASAGRIPLLDLEGTPVVAVAGGPQAGELTDQRIVLALERAAFLTAGREIPGNGALEKPYGTSKNSSFC
jgi:hypothetical protein